jgi:exosome complex exonuclease RRP6
MEQNKFLGAYANFDGYASDLFDKLLKATKAANGLPDADNFKYYTSYPPFKGSMNNYGQRLLDLTQKFLDFEKAQKAPLLNVYEDTDDVLEQFDAVVDVVDSLIERVVRLKTFLFLKYLGFICG